MLYLYENHVAEKLKLSLKHMGSFLMKIIRICIEN